MPWMHPCSALCLGNPVKYDAAGASHHACTDPIDIQTIFKNWTNMYMYKLKPMGTCADEEHLSCGLLLRFCISESNTNRCEQGSQLVYAQ